MSEPVLQLSAIAVEYGRGGQRVRAVDGVDLAIARGEVVGLVGESGCGKSTLARAAVGLEPLAAGHVTFEGHDVTHLGRRRRPTYLRGLQMVFQDPYESLNPRRKVGEIVAEPLNIWSIGTVEERKAKVREVLEAVGLDPDTAVDKRPHEFSGGQRQRIAIARTLATQPSCLIADEPISALDASAQAQIANLLGELVKDADLGLVLVSHDLSVVRQVADRVAVMYLGKLCEVGSPDTLYAEPAHPYTNALLASIPVPDPTAKVADEPPLRGELPSPIDPPSGCRFRTRCPRAQERCAAEEPQLRRVDEGHFVACHFPLVEPVPDSPAPAVDAVPS